MIKTTSELALEIGVPAKFLAFISSRADKYYKNVHIKKKNGGYRPINSPSYQIKAIQAWILRNVLEKQPCHSAAHGFIQGRSIKSNVQPHLKNKYLLCMDIKDFFPTIGKNRVVDLFQGIGYEGELLGIFSDITTYRGYLPQGAVTSPYISNLIFLKTDEVIAEYCGSRDISFTRYADDLAFSSNDLHGLKSISEDIYSILRTHGFQPNLAKTRIYTGKGRKLLTGLVINSKKPSIGKNRKRIIRSMMYHFIVKGVHIDENELLGMISFLLDIEPDKENKLHIYKKKLLSKRLGESKPDSDNENSNARP